MTPQARVAAAIDVLDAILHGDPAEKTLTNWARKNRYAGSKDRAAVRDLVFDALRQKRSAAHQGKAMTGRGLMIGLLRLSGTDPAEMFTGQRYAPPALSAEEAEDPDPLEQADAGIRLDCPDWLFPRLRAPLGADTEACLLALRQRAPVFLRANLAKTTRETAIAALAKEGIEGRGHELSATAIEVLSNPRKVRTSKAFMGGLVELQDAASQAVVDRLVETVPTGRVLDYCAGGGGKALALAAAGLEVVAHDSDASRMRDIPERARRAGVEIATTAAPSGLFDAVLCDAPCSGSGAWRRQPDAKWQLTAERLSDLTEVQDTILESASRLVRAGGVLAYATCSLLSDENDARIAAFLAQHQGWRLMSKRLFRPLDGGDGFFIALLTHS